MKFDEQQKKFHNEGQIHKLFSSLQGHLDRILHNNSQSISFQLAYDQVYKLSKHNQQATLLQTIEKHLSTFLHDNLENNKDYALSWILKQLKDTQEASHRIVEICLYLDLNYCRKVSTPLQDKLNTIIYSTFSNNQHVVQTIATASFNARTSPCKQLNEVLDILQKIDPKMGFFEKCLLSHYIPLIQKHYQTAAETTWKASSIEAYIQWSKSKLAEEENFVWETLSRKRKKEGVQAVVAAIYEVIVAAYKEKIYQTEQKKIFQELTLPILELLRFGKGKEVEGHVQWFMSGIEKRLNLLPTDENTTFIDSFCELFWRVGELLKGTQSKFQIHYRSTFTFEEWLNNEKYNIPLRLNLYIHNQITSPNLDFSLFTTRVTLIFKLIKQKGVFQNLYRRNLITRLVQDYTIYDIQKEDNIIKPMQIQCGDEWAQKIKAIIDLFTKDREKIFQKKSITQPKTCQYLKLGGLVPIVIPQTSWPFEPNSKIKINDALLKLTIGFENDYIQQLKKQRLVWTSKAGTVVLNIRFKTNKRQFLVSTDMANLLLYIETSPKKLNHFICQNGYSVDEVQAFLQKLVQANLVQSKQQGNDYELSLRDQFAQGNIVDLLHQHANQKLEVNVMQELKADRKLMVEAILVKIMKGQKMCRKEELMEKSVPLVTQRGFKFNAEFVQKSIERLVDKEFLRDYEDGSIGYIA